jgi:hypothetical protein
MLKTQALAEQVINYYEISKVKRYACRYLGLLFPCLNIPYHDDPNHLIGDKRVFIDRAPEPLDIIWPNLARTSKKWWLMRTVSVYLIVIVMLVPIFFIVGKIIN